MSSVCCSIWWFFFDNPWSGLKREFQANIVARGEKKSRLWVEAWDFALLHMHVVGLISTFHCQGIHTEWEAIHLEAAEIWLGYKKLLWMKNEAQKMRLGQINWDSWYDEHWQEMSRAWLSSGVRFLDPHLRCPTDGSINCRRHVIPYINCGWTEGTCCVCPHIAATAVYYIHPQRQDLLIRCDFLKIFTL